MPVDDPRRKPLGRDGARPKPECAALADLHGDPFALAETLALLRTSGIEHQLRTTRWPGLTEPDFAEIAQIATGSPHVWQDYRAVTA